MKLKELQKESNKTIKQSAEKMGLAFSTYNNYLMQSREPDIKTLIKLADYFDVSLDYLCDRPFNNNVGYIPEDKKEIIRKVLKVNNTNNNKLEGYIDGLISNQ